MKKEKPTTKICKHCQTEISAKAKICPQCRKKQGMGLIPKIFIGIFVLAIIGAVAGGGESDTSLKTNESVAAVEETTQAIVYTSTTVTEMKKLLDTNAMKASETYKNQYLEITGILSVIDSDGKYISLVGDGPYEILGVRCYIENEEQKKIVMEMELGDTVTLRGKCTSVGEVIGYSLDIDSID